MNLHAYLTRGIIWGQRQFFGRHPGTPLGIVPSTFNSVDACNEAISELLTGDKPCMITRFGSVEKDAFEREFDHEAAGTVLLGWLNIIRGKGGPFWFDDSVRHTMNNSAGFFPPSDEMLRRFYYRIKEDCKLIDLHASWYPGEQRLKSTLYPLSRTCAIEELSPFHAAQPWTKSLMGKNVLVIHPFAASIASQYQHREDLFDDPNFLPEFNLLTYKPVVSFCGEETQYTNWFEALDAMTADIAQIDFDIAIIGAGAYGMPLAAAIKRMRKKAFHFGGATQLLFGIKGRRWKNSPLFKDTWCRPLPEETPKNSLSVEQGCYW